MHNVALTNISGETNYFHNFCAVSKIKRSSPFVSPRMSLACS